MQKPPIPFDEQARVKALEDLQILNTPSEERFDRLTRLASRVFQVPIALVSLVDETRQWFKSAQGLAACETPRDISFCGHAIIDAKPLIVEDASKDRRFSDNPLVIGAPNIRFYAGYPLNAPSGHRVGTLCVIDVKPRAFPSEDVAQLRDLAQLVETEMRAAKLSDAQVSLIQERDTYKRLSMIDRMTRLWNREAVLEVLRRELSRAERDGSSVAVGMIDLDHFKRINDEHGHPAGDAVLTEAAQRIRGACRPYDAVGRYGGEEYIVVLPGTDGPEAERVGERIRAELGRGPVTWEGKALAMTGSVGVASGIRTAPGALIRAADEALYRAKREGRNRMCANTVPSSPMR